MPTDIVLSRPTNVGSSFEIVHPACSQDRICWRLGMGRTVEIFDIQVCGEHRRLGRGRWLIENLKQESPDNTALIFAVTRITNTIAHEFYESLGFRIVGRLHKFYRDGGREDHALLFGLDV